MAFHQPVSGRLLRSAMLCTPRPSRRFAMRTMEQCALTSIGTIASCRHMVWRTALFFFLFPVRLVAIANFFQIFPVFLAWHCALLAPSFRCHREISPRWRLALFVFPIVRVENDSNEFSVQCDLVQRQFMHACDTFSVSPCRNGFVGGNFVGFSSVTHSEKFTLKTCSFQRMDKTKTPEDSTGATELGPTWRP